MAVYKQYMEKQDRVTVLYLFPPCENAEIWREKERERERKETLMLCYVMARLTF